jgi:hypothetical protein
MGCTARALSLANADTERLLLAVSMTSLLVVVLALIVPLLGAT